MATRSLLPGRRCDSAAPGSLPDVRSLTTEVRGFGDTVQEGSDQNKQFLAVSTQIVDLTKEDRCRFPGGRTAGSGSSGPKDDARPGHQAIRPQKRPRNGVPLSHAP